MTNLTELFIVFTGIFAVFLWSDMHATPPPPLEEVVAKVAPVQEPVTILFAGDMMLGRHVGKLIAAHGAEHPFEKIASSLAEISPDLFIANLEGPITELAAPDSRVSPEQPYSMRFSFDPEVTSAIKDIGFTHLSLANNHTLDQGGQGVRDTIAHLSAAGVVPFGTRDGPALGTVATTTVRGRDLVFVGLDTTIIVHDAGAVREALAAFPESTFVAVLVHWGNEYEAIHSSAQETFAHLLINSGADLVVGAHPHVVQDVDTYKGKRIYYSLGNFVFDQYWNEAVQTGLMVLVTLDGDRTAYQELPVKSVRSQPAVTEVARLD